MQTHQWLKNIRNLLFIFVSMSIIVAGADGSLAASTQETKSVRDSSFKSFIRQVKHNYGKQYASHVEELFKVLLREEKFDPADAGPHFLEFDVLKMRETVGTYQTAIIKDGNLISTRDNCKSPLCPGRDAAYISSRLKRQVRFSRCSHEKSSASRQTPYRLT